MEQKRFVIMNEDHAAIAGIALAGAALMLALLARLALIDNGTCQSVCAYMQGNGTKKSAGMFVVTNRQTRDKFGPYDADSAQEAVS